MKKLRRHLLYSAVLLSSSQMYYTFDGDHTIFSRVAMTTHLLSEDWIFHDHFTYYTLHAHDMNIIESSLPLLSVAF